MIEDDEDRAVFLADFNEPDDSVIVVTPDVGEPYDLPLAIFDARPMIDDPSFRGGAKISGANPQMRCRASEFPLSLIGKCTVTVRGQPYSAYDVKPDATGMTTVELRKKGGAS